MNQSAPKPKNKNYLKVIGVGNGTATIVNRLCLLHSTLNDDTKKSQIEFIKSLLWKLNK